MAKEKNRRAKDDEHNVMESGFNYHDPVSIEENGNKIPGRVHAIHADGKIDVKINHPGHKHDGRVLTFKNEDVDLEDEPKESKEKAKGRVSYGG